MRAIDGAGRFRAAGRASYVEHLRVPQLSVGTYSIPAGGTDPQEVHTEDEVYLVVDGHAWLWTPQGRVEVERGSVVFVPAGEQHRFIDIDRDLTVLVVFGPAERTARLSLANRSTEVGVDWDSPGETGVD